MAGYNLAQDKIIYVWDAQRREAPLAGNQSWEREGETAGERGCPRVAYPQQFEDLSNSLVGWSFKLIGFNFFHSLVLRVDLRQDHLRLGCSEAWGAVSRQSKLRKKGMIKAENERKKLLAKEAALTSRTRSSLNSEGLLNSLVGWWLKLIVFKIYSTLWSCEGRSSTRALPARSWKFAPSAVETLTEL